MPASIRSRALRIDNPFEAPDPERSDTEVRRRTRAGLGVPEGGWLYGYFANLYGRKRPYAFIDAAAEIMRRRSNAFFIMSGDDRTITREEVRSAARSRGIGDRLTTLPFTSEVFDRMRACDVILAPAVDEPFGRVLVEAMMLGVPVVAANSGGHGEILKPGCGVLVPPDDTAALADAAVQLVDDAQWRAQLVERARAEARSRFSVEAHVSAIERVYADMLGDRRAAPGRNVGRKLLRGWL